MVTDFKETACNVCAPDRVSGNYTNNFNSLDHIVSDLRDTGGVEYIHAMSYEKSHRDLKEYYRLTSRRKNSEMSEAIYGQAGRIITRV